MKAAMRSKYGLPPVLSVKECEVPTLKKNEVLVRVFATTVNRTDIGILLGKPFIMRVFTGLSKPRLAITGSDFAGQVEAINENVTSFKIGDKVMGFGMMGVASHAQYMAVQEKGVIITMPGNTAYSQAAACIEGALYAFIAINVLEPRAGQKALVNGATGAIGSSIVQILKFYGVYVTAVCGGENSELGRALGADKIIDYKNEDFTKDGETYDFIFDAVGKSTFRKCLPLLNDNGIYIPSDGFYNVFLSLITPIFGGKKVIFPFPKITKTSLNCIKKLVEKGNFAPVIDRTYPIDNIVEAYNYVATGQKIGNVIITMDV